MGDERERTIDLRDHEAIDLRIHPQPDQRVPGAQWNEVVGRWEVWNDIAGHWEPVRDPVRAPLHV